MYLNTYNIKTFLIFITFTLFTFLLFETNCQSIQLPIINDREIKWSLPEDNELLLILDIEQTISGKRLIGKDAIKIGKDKNNNEVYNTPNSFFIDFHNNKINFLLSYIENTNKLSLSHKPLNNEFSFIHQMHKEKFINKPKFAIEINKNHINQSLYLGDIPKQNLKPYKNIIKINAEQKTRESIREYWGFNVTSFKIGEDILIPNKTIFISLTHESMVTNKDVYEWIKNKVMINYIESGICNEDVSGWGMIHCNISVFENLPLMYFVFSEKPYKAVSMKLQGCEYESEFNIAYNPTLDESYYMFINRNLFFDKIIQFDYEEDTITFYSKILPEIESTLNVKKLLLNIVGLICFLYLVYLIFLVFKMKKSI